MTTLRGAQPTVLAGSGVARGQDWRTILEGALRDALEPLGGVAPDLLVLFAHEGFGQSYRELVATARDTSEAAELIGCSASGVIGGDQEVEGEPSISAMALKLPRGAFLGVQHVPSDEVEGTDWPKRLGVLPNACTGLIVLADPYTTDVEALVANLAEAYPGAPIVGGLASGTPHSHGTYVFTGGDVRGEGAIVMALSGTVGLHAVVSQGAEPIGAAWTITSAERNILYTIGNRPTYEVLIETLQALPEPERTRVSQNLLVGIAMDEYRDAFGRGDFLIRNLLGVDPRNGAVAVGAHLQVGQTLQFQVRDARAADEELRSLLSRASDDLREQPPAAALLFACNGRGQGLFGEPSHDARATAAQLDRLPLAGLFCNGEIGPVGRHTYMHGFTASLGLIVPRGGSAEC